MHKVLQALLDTIQLAAGAVDLGSSIDSPAHHSQHMHRRAAAKPAINHDLPSERVDRSEPQSFVSEPALRTSAEKSRS